MSETEDKIEESKPKAKPGKPDAKAAEPSAKLAPAVHGLDKGLPVCGFSDEPPSAWPAGQTWTDWPDFETMTCPECRKWSADKLHQMARARAGFVAA